MIGGAEVNPFPGLPSYGLRPEIDRKYFYGRDRVIEELSVMVANRRFAACIGNSGCGKSSIVNCGIEVVFSARVEGRPDWAVVKMRPGDDPFEALAISFGITSKGNGLMERSPDVLEDELRASPRSLTQLWETCCALRPNPSPTERLLLIVDQSEDLFRLTLPGTSTPSRDASAFVQLLLEACSTIDGRVHVLLCLRAEDLGLSTMFDGLTEKINAGGYLVPMMTRTELGIALRTPFEKTGRVVTSNVSDHLLDLASDGHITLSQLQHLLMRLWSASQSGTEVSLATLVSVGGASGALQVQGEELLRQCTQALVGQKHALVSEDWVRSLCSAVLLSCINFSVSPPKKAARSIESLLQRVRESATAGNESNVAIAVSEIIETFAHDNARFLIQTVSPVGGTTYIELAHDTLIQNWRQLSEWVDEERTFLRERNGLRETYMRHQHRGELNRALTRVEVGEWLQLDHTGYEDTIVPAKARELWFHRLESDLQSMIVGNYREANRVEREHLQLVQDLEQQRNNYSDVTAELDRIRKIHAVTRRRSVLYTILAVGGCLLAALFVMVWTYVVAKSTAQEALEKTVEAKLAITEIERTVVAQKVLAKGARIAAAAVEEEATKALERYSGTLNKLLEEPKRSASKAYPKEEDLAYMQLMASATGVPSSEKYDSLMQLSLAGYRRAAETPFLRKPAVDLSRLANEPDAGKGAVRLKMLSYDSLLAPAEGKTRAFVKEIAEMQGVSDVEYCEIIAPWLEGEFRAWSENGKPHMPGWKNLRDVRDVLLKKKPASGESADIKESLLSEHGVALLDAMTNVLNNERLASQDAKQHPYSRFRAFRDICYAWLAFSAYLDEHGEAEEKIAKRLESFESDDSLWLWAKNFSGESKNNEPIDPGGVELLRERFRLQLLDFAAEGWENSGYTATKLPSSKTLNVNSSVLPGPYRIRAELLKYYVFYFKGDVDHRLVVGTGIAGFAFRTFIVKGEGSSERRWTDEAAQILGDFTVLQFTKFCELKAWSAARALTKKGDGVSLAETLSNWNNDTSLKLKFSAPKRKSGKIRPFRKEGFLIPIAVDVTENGGQPSPLAFDVFVPTNENRAYIRRRRY